MHSDKKGTRGELTKKYGYSSDPIPLSIYRCPEHFQREKEQIFSRAWLLIGREEQFREPGQYLKQDIHPLNVSLIINRSSQGKIQSFYNVCAHRGSQLVSSNEGKCARFVCPYHSWTYKHNGELMGVPDEANFHDLDKSKLGLKPVATETWNGWIFVNLSPEPEVTLEEYLGPMASHLQGLVYPSPDNFLGFSATLECNWKAASDAFVESYHIPFIHPQTLKSTFSGPANPYSRLLDATPLGIHQAVSMFGNTDYQAPANNLVEKFSQTLSSNQSVISGNSSKETESFLAHQNVNPTNSPDWSMDVNNIFPHVHIDTGPGGFWTHHFWPVSPTKTHYEVKFYLSKPKDFTERFQQELFASRVAEVVLEDVINMKRTQTGIDSSPFSTIPLQDSEVGIRHLVNRVLKFVNSDTVKEALK